MHSQDNRFLSHVERFFYLKKKGLKKKENACGNNTYQAQRMRRFPLWGEGMQDPISFGGGKGTPQLI